MDVKIVRNISESEKMKGLFPKLMDSDGLMDVSHKMVDVTQMWIMKSPSQLGTILEGALAFPDWYLFEGGTPVSRDVIVLGMLRSTAADGCGARGIS